MELFGNIHPLIVHFPIVIFTLYVLAEIPAVITEKDFFNKAAMLLLLLGVISGIAAVLTGNLAAASAADKFKEVIEEHETWASVTQWYFTALFFYRLLLTLKKKFSGSAKYAALFFALLGMFFIYETGEHGGKLVYKYGVGTDLLIENPVYE